MCTRPDRHSISTSAHALWDAALSLMFACGALLLALAFRTAALARATTTEKPRAATVGHVDVQVHLDDRKCVAEIKRVLRQTLRLTARTWAPLTLPIDRLSSESAFRPAVEPMCTTNSQRRTAKPMHRIFAAIGGRLPRRARR